jgi:hypothetical protein
MGWNQVLGPDQRGGVGGFPVAHVYFPPAVMMATFGR